MGNDRLTGLFGEAAAEFASAEEQLAFLKGYQDGLREADPNAPPSILDPCLDMSAECEAAWRAGAAKAQRDWETKTQVEAAVLAAMIAAS